VTWMEALQEMAPIFDEEFGTLARITPMIGRPNRRMEIDTSRPVQEVMGVFHETHKLAGDGRRNTDGLSETSIAAVQVSFSVETGVLCSPVTQGDVVEICEIGRTFRVIDLQFEIAHRTKFVLEDLKAPAR